MICPVCNEDFLKCDEHGCWKDWAVLDNSRNKPKYSPAVTNSIGAVILALMLSGVSVGMWGHVGTPKVLLLNVVLSVLAGVLTGRWINKYRKARGK